MSDGTYMGDLHGVVFDDDGPDGQYLRIDTDQGEVVVRFEYDQATLFMEALRPCLEWVASRESHRAEYMGVSPAVRERVLGSGTDWLAVAQEIVRGDAERIFEEADNARKREKEDA